MAQGEDPLLLDPKADELRNRVDRDGRGADRRDRDDDRGGRADRGDRADRGPRRSQPMTAYRIEVGRRHRVEPRQIVGALANEGGLRRDDFGAIRIQPDFSIVELPADMDGGVLDRLTDTGSAASSSRSSPTVVAGVAAAAGSTATTATTAGPAGADAGLPDRTGVSRRLVRVPFVLRKGAAQPARTPHEHRTIRC